MLLGGVDFKSLAITLKAAEGKTAAVLLNYGDFIQTVVDFAIVAFVIFMVIKAMNNLKKQEPVVAPAAPGPTAEQLLLTEIRDAIRSIQ